MQEADSSRTGGPPIAALRQRIVAAREVWDRRATRERRNVLRLGKYHAALVPAAVLLLTIQILACPAGQCRGLGIALISAELAILFLALFLLFARVGPAPRTWARSRLRAELIRREEYLLVTRVGPYTATREPDRLSRVLEVRLTRLAATDTNPIDYVRIESGPDSNWRDELEDAAPCGGAEPEPEAAAAYLDERLRGQQAWYSGNSAARARSNTLLENIARGVLIGALVVSAMHLIILIACPMNLKLPIEILAIVLPPVGAAIGGIQTLLQYHRLSRTYNYYSRAMTELIARLTELQVRAHPGAPADPDHSRQRLEFKRLVLRTEELLAAELCHWYFFIA